MKKNLIALAVAAAFVVPGMAFASTNGVFTPANNNNDTGPILYGYAQITGAQQWGTSTNGSASGSNGLVFGANRIRLGVKGEAVPGVTYNIEAGWDGAAISGSTSAPNSGNLLNDGLGNNGNASIINAWLNYAPVPFAQLEVGKFKLPVGNEYVSKAGNELPFVFRSMAQSLLPGRSAGAMIHANDVMGTGVNYAVGFADDTSLDAYNAYNWTANDSMPFGSGQSGYLNGSGNYIAFARLGYDFMGPLLKAEVSGSRMSLGSASEYYPAGNPVAPEKLSQTAIYTWNVGVHGGIMGVHYEASYTNMTSGRSFSNVTTSTQPYLNNKGMLATDWNVGLGVNLHQMTLTPSWLDIEPAVRFDSFSINNHNGYDAKIDNTTVGLNYFVNPNNQHAAEIQLNYIIPTARQGNFGTGTPGGVFGANGAPINGMAYNTLMLQFQAGF